MQCTKGDFDTKWLQCNNCASYNKVLLLLLRQTSCEAYRRHNMH